LIRAETDPRPRLFQELTVDTLLLFAQASPAPELSMSIRVPLSIMNFLQFAIWGAWFVVLGNYLNTLNFSRTDIGRIYATMSLGTVIAPMFIGTVADRFFPSQQVLAVSHLVGAGLLYWMSQIKTPRQFYWVALLYALAYAPTLALTNAIIFKNIPDATRDFGPIRVLGTIGWIVVGLSLKVLIKPGQPVNNRPLLLAAGLSLILGVYSFTLPDTPPGSTEPINDFADFLNKVPFFQAFALLKEPSFAIFFGVSFFITIALAFYYSFTALFLESDIKVKPQNVGPIMTIGQFMEIIFLYYLSDFLGFAGMKWILAIGMAAWGLRYGLFSLRGPLPLILFGIALHGICFDFFFAAGFIHVQKTAPEAISNSAQSLFAVLTYGLGMFLGTELSGRLNQHFTSETVDPDSGEKVRTTDWRSFWLVPCIGCVIALVIFLVFFQG
jgi:nucleoside transporter